MKGKRSVIAVLAVLALIVVNVLLFTVLRERNVVDRGAVAVGEVPQADFDFAGQQPEPAEADDEAEPAEAPKPEPEPEPEADETDDESLQRVQRLLAVGSDGSLWRAHIVQCGEQGLIEVSLDGGQTFTDASAPGVAPVRIKPTGYQSGFVVGADLDCDPTLQTTDSAGASWVRSDGALSSSWYLSFDGSETIYSPYGGFASPCEAGTVEIGGFDTDNASALCQDSRVFLTADGGQSWRAGPEIAGASVLGMSDLQYLVGSLGVEDCAGMRVHDVSLDGGVQTLGCVETAELAAGDLALAGLGMDYWVWAGDNLSYSADGGISWQ